MDRVVPFSGVYIDSTGSFLPGPAIDNEAIDRFVAPVNKMSSRIKRRILAENGIATRHYAIDEQGTTRFSVTAMAAGAVRACAAKVGDAPVGLLASATSGADLLLPGLANQVQAELAWAPLTTASHHGVCASGMQALADAARSVDRGEHDAAMVVASESPSRLFKCSRFAPGDYDLDFDAHFLRWMLSDAAGAWRVSSRPAADRLSLKLHFVHSQSHAGDYPLCMQMGLPHAGGTGWLDHPNAAAAERAGALLLRQDIRLLPHLFDVGIHAYADLVRHGAVDPAGIDHFLCHYSSARFRGVVRECLERAELAIPEQRWYSNLATRGNTGAASIFVMLDDFLAERTVAPGEKILLFVPESGRFTVSFALLEVVGPDPSPRETQTAATQTVAETYVDLDAPPPPHDPASVDAARKPELATLLLELAGIWSDFRSRAWRSAPVRRIVVGRFTQQDYLNWMSHWIPQVREGTRWMRTAVDNLSERYAPLRALIEGHADGEQDDYQILFEDYRRAGGSVEDLDALQRNPGGEALNAFLHAQARQTDAVGLLGAIYIIEGSGQRLIPALLPLIRRQLSELGPVFRFLHYHGEYDMAHLQRWLIAVELGLECSPDAAATMVDITRTAQRTAALYLMQLEDAA
ncbi:MAG: 3-oxoacyl-ACP synthase [Gammaproteobacteria bacterium]|nr:3-oxoacyl-ACP synthase [Gammaproteobacteria bacterium]